MAKWLTVCLQTKWLWVWVLLQSSCTHKKAIKESKYSYIAYIGSASASTFPIFTTWVDKKKKIEATIISYCSMVTFPHFKSWCTLPFENVQKKVQLFFNYYLAVPWQILGYSQEDSLTNLKVTGSFVKRLGR